MQFSLKFHLSRTNLRLTRTLLSFMAFLMGFQMTLDVPGWSFIAGKVHGQFRDILNSPYLKAWSSMQNIRVSRILYFILNNYQTRDLGCGWLYTDETISKQDQNCSQTQILTSPLKLLSCYIIYYQSLSPEYYTDLKLTLAPSLTKTIFKQSF